MAVIALASASGAPGVTTTALALTLLWPRPALLVEAGPYGSSAILAGYLRGAVAPGGRSVLGLARAHRLGRLSEAIDENAVPLDDEGRHRLLPAIAQPEQASSLRQLWEPLSEVLADLGSTGPEADDGPATDAPETGGYDVIVDAGRLGAAAGPDALVSSADVVLLCVRTQLPAIAAARARLQSFDVQGRVALAIVGDGRPYTGAEISRLTATPVLTSLAWDPPAADVLAVGATRPRRWESSAFLRSAAAAAEAVQREVATAGRRSVPPDVKHLDAAIPTGGSR